MTQGSKDSQFFDNRYIQQIADLIVIWQRAIKYNTENINFLKVEEQFYKLSPGCEMIIPRRDVGILVIYELRKNHLRTLPRETLRVTLVVQLRVLPIPTEWDLSER